MNNKLSVIILTKDEENNIVDCLDSVGLIRTLDEIIIIDDDSTNNTITLAKKFKVNIYTKKHPQTGVFLYFKSGR